ncbi:MAG: hypothetical protein U0414_08455 [Polyangiaceae bacterium]
MRKRALFLLSMLTVAGCASDEPWTSGSTLEAILFDDGAGARTLIDFRVRPTGRYCEGMGCGRDVRLTESFRETPIEGLTMQGLAGDDGSWMLEAFYDAQRGGPCSFVKVGDTYRCGYAERYPTATTVCDAYALACDPTAETCKAGALVQLATPDFDVAFYTLEATTAAVPEECVIERGCAGCQNFALTKTDPATLPELHTRWVGTGRYQVESWSNEDGSWTVPKEARVLKDMDRLETCYVQRPVGDADPVCEPM